MIMMESLCASTLHLQCSSTYADIRWTDEAEFIAEDPKLKNLVEIYLKNKERKLRNIVFDANTTEGGEIKRSVPFKFLFFSERSLPYNLQVLMVGIGSATYDQIEYDLAFTLEGALGLVGGTMGLFSGFSVLSGVEIVFYLAKLIGKRFTKRNTKPRKTI